jgi:putative ABC transport system ATP-binding protein
MSDRHETPVLRARGLSREYHGRSATVRAVHDVDLDLNAGESVAVMGPSGCGKSTLLGMLGGLDRPTAGTVVLDGHDITGYTRHQMARFRRTVIGYVPQSPSLLPMLTAEENIDLPLTLVGLDEKERRTRVQELLQLMELENNARSLPEELSGGQQQRVSVARALAARPQILLADEPAGSLDTTTAHTVLRLLGEEVRRENRALLLVTHERDEAREANRIVYMKDGVLVGEEILA